ncbi:hypothetical protein GJ699_03820 [Duganella sp. FT80W]|uniref:Uncharacterized protein n=1 Tax=Duganella guangzhouensis TaxID=2666084 RepID=A0A6I2KY33_9BURK|nr:hypothetical protein [Duganella guangzhouensis]MRW89106.1 hypothetical protein [Duganella guangzhouensis]
MIYWLIAIACGYAIGTFTRQAWWQYAVCVPASGLLYFLVNLMRSMPSEESELSPVVIFIGASLIQSLGLMLGVFLARRKAKRNAFKA